MHPRSSYEALKTSIIKSGRVQPNLEAKQRLERFNLQRKNLNENLDRIYDICGTRSMKLFPKYSERVLTKITNFLSNHEKQNHFGQ